MILLRHRFLRLIMQIESRQTANRIVPFIVAEN